MRERRLALAGALALAACTERVPLVTSADGGAPLSAVDPQPPFTSPRDGGGFPRFDGPRFDLRAADAACRESPAMIPVPATLEHAELMFAIDRSRSMIEKTFANGTANRLSVVQQNVRALVRRFQGLVRFGYEEFPVKADTCPSGCCAGHVVVPQSNSYQDIDRWTNRGDQSSYGCFDLIPDAPTNDALDRALQLFDGVAQMPRHVVLVTDGEPSCGGASVCDKAVYKAAQLADVAGARTMVVGIGDDVKGNACLDMIANAGRRNAPASNTWVSDEGQLAQAMQAAVGSAATCALRLPGEIAPERLTITFEGMQVPRDPNMKDGWNPDPAARTRIVFYGSWCDRMRAGTIQERDVGVTAHCRVCPGTIAPDCR